jgi:hypothetical protein
MSPHLPNAGRGSPLQRSRDPPDPRASPEAYAEVAAKAVLESRGNAPRLYRNTLVFLAADKVRLQDLDEALRKYLAWSSIVGEKETLNLDPHQARQAETQKQAADGSVTARLPETYQWLLVPEQPTPQSSMSTSAASRYFPILVTSARGRQPPAIVDRKARGCGDFARNWHSHYHRRRGDSVLGHR